jgi:predicted porin
MGMKNKFMAAAAVVAILTATGAQAQTADIATLKEQSAALKKQNAALEARLNKLEKEQVAQAKASAAQPASTAFMAADLSSVKGLPIPQCALPALDGPLTFCGITIFGTIDAGLGWVNNGLPINSKFYQGNESIVATGKAGHPYFGIVPNGLSTSTLGVKGTQEIWNGWSGVFMASTNINPQSGQLANGAGSLVDNNGINRNSQSLSGSGSRGGQAFNDQLYVGVSNKDFGQLTFGRHRSFGTDLAVAYDPASSNAYSLIGYSGTYAAGIGNTENARWDNSLKYRVEFPVGEGFSGRFGLMYKFIDGNGGSTVGNGYTATTQIASNTVIGGVPQYFTSHNDAGQIALGGSYGALDIDGVLGYYHQSISPSSLSAPQLNGTSTFASNVFNPAAGAFRSTVTTGNNNAGTLAGTAEDTAGGAIGAKYTWNQFKFYAGWAHAVLNNPKDVVGIGAQTDQGGYNLSSVNNGAFPNTRVLDTFWGGARYAYSAQLDFAIGYYHVNQNGYGFANGTPLVASFGTAAAGGPASNSSLATCGLPAYINNVNGATFVTPAGVRHYNYQSAPRSGTCSGQFNQIGGFVDYHFNKRFDIYAGMAYSVATGGLASGYINPNNWSPTIGARFTF